MNFKYFVVSGNVLYVNRKLIIVKSLFYGNATSTQLFTYSFARKLGYTLFYTV